MAKSIPPDQPFSGAPTFFRAVSCKSASCYKLQTTSLTWVAWLLGQVLHLHVLDQVPLIPDRLLADEADVLPRGDEVALEGNEGVRLCRGCGEPI